MHPRPPPILLLLIYLCLALTQLTGCDGCGEPSPGAEPQDPRQAPGGRLAPALEDACQQLCEAAATCADPCTVDAVRCQRRCIAEDWAAPAGGECRALGEQLAQVSPPLVACPAAAPPGPDEPRPMPSAQRVCSSHTISIDFPLDDFPAALMEGLQPRDVDPSLEPLTVWMTEAIPKAAQVWLNARIQGADGLIRVEIEPLFEIAGIDTGYEARYGWEAFRLRHWRLTVVGSKLGAPVPIPGALFCEFLKFLRTEVQNRTELDAEPYIARECDASRQDMGVPPPPDPGPVPDPSARGELWHLDQLYAPDRPPSGTASGQGQGKVHLAILDTPISTADASSLSASAPQAGPATKTHPHALAMGLFARQIAPRAKVFFYQALDSNAGTPVGNTAIALERMLSDHGWVPHLRWSPSSAGSPSDPPLVVNLSLGWPPEYGAATAVGDCREDPVGESVHTMLRMIRALRDEGGKPILVFAAAGNRALPPAWGEVDDDFAPHFYPAQWGWEDLAIPIRATANGPLALNAASVWVPILALPGIDVPVPKHPSLDRHLRRMTGTSVSTILMSAIAAEIGEGLTLGQSQPVFYWFRGIPFMTCADGPVPSFNPSPSARNCPGGDLLVTAGETFLPPPPEDALTVGAEFIISEPDSDVVRSPNQATPDRWAAGSFTSQPDVIICPGGDCRLHFPRRPVSRAAYVEARLALPEDSTITNVRLDMEWDPTPGGKVGDLAAKSIEIVDGGKWLLEKKGRLMGLPAGIFPPVGALPTASFRLTFDLKRGDALEVRREVWLKRELHDSP